MSCLYCLKRLFIVDIVPVCFRLLIHTADTEQLIHKIFFFVIQVNDLYRFSLDQIENIVVCNKGLNLTI